MLRAITPILLLTLCAAQNTTPNEAPYQTMERLYTPILPFHTDLSWSLKVNAATASEAKFLTSTRELFYLWAKEHCKDWLADPDAYVTCHGDVHLGNLGTYVADIPTARLAIGLKDFDESAVMPFQTDLLQAATSLRATAAADGHPLDETLAARAIDELISAYRSTLRSGQSATEALRKDPAFSKLLKNNDTPLREAVDQFFTGDTFRPAIKNKKGEIKDRLLPALKDLDGLAPAPADFPAPYTKDVLAAALSQARKDSPLLTRLLVPKNSEEFELAIVSAALRYRAGSGGSQGQPKLLVHLRAAVKTLTNPNDKVGGTTDAVLYFKGQSDTAAVRAGYIKPTRIPGGQRNLQAALGLCSPQPDALGHITLLDQSYLISLYTPWDEEPKFNLNSDDDVLQAARILGTILAAAHRNATVDQGAAILQRITPKLKEQLLYRSAADQQRNKQAYEAFLTTPAVPGLRQKAQAFLSAK